MSQNPQVAKVPPNPPIFHITHITKDPPQDNLTAPGQVEAERAPLQAVRASSLSAEAPNLPGIIQHGGLWCDSQRIAKNLVSTNIGLLHIKNRRLSRTVTVQAGGVLGDYVPFNFCPRSVMLSSINYGHKNYTGGQQNIVHLVSSVNDAIALGRPWAFSDRHAELGQALHFDNLNDLHEVHWDVMPLKYWSHVKEERQAEFLVKDFFEWIAIKEIAVHDQTVYSSVQNILNGVSHKPNLTIKPVWYY